MLNIRDVSQESKKQTFTRSQHELNTLHRGPETKKTFSAYGPQDTNVLNRPYLGTLVEFYARKLRLSHKKSFTTRYEEETRI